MTITNHLQKIQDLAGETMDFVDGRTYPRAHIALDDIEKEVRAAHRHIDHLQNVTEFGEKHDGV